MNENADGTRGTFEERNQDRWAMLATLVFAAGVLFTNVAGATFTAPGTGNVRLLESQWTELGQLTEISRGRFQFTDQQAGNFSRRFYSVRAD